MIRPAPATYRIWSGEHHAWWRPDSAGYTDHREAAGLYTRAVAREILAGVGPEKRLKAIPIDRAWIVHVDLASPFEPAQHRLMAPTSSGARYKSFRACREAGYAAGWKTREAFLWFSRNVVLRVERDRSGET